jgi:hypothetical protein
MPSDKFEKKPPLLLIQQKKVSKKIDLQERRRLGYGDDNQEQATLRRQRRDHIVRTLLFN